MHILITVHGFPPTHADGAEQRTERMVRWLAAHRHKVTVVAIEHRNASTFSVETQRDQTVTIYRISYNNNEGDAFRNQYQHPRIGEFIRELLVTDSFDLVHVISGYLIGEHAIYPARERGIPVAVTLTEFWFLCARLNLLTMTNHRCEGPDSDLKCARCLLEDKRRFRYPAIAAPQITDSLWNVARAIEIPFLETTIEAVAERRVALKNALDAANLVICPSQFLKDTFTKYAFNTSRFRFMRQGTLAPPSNLMKNHSAATPGKMLRLGYIGQIKPHKGVDLAISAASELLEQGHHITLDIWGPLHSNSGYISALKRRTDSIPEIVWRGSYESNKIWQVLSTLDVLLVPSRWYENSPNVILEAYQMGLPVIASNLGGMAELVEHGKSGLVFVPDNGHDLAYQIKRLIQEPKLIQHLRSNLPRVKTINEEMEEMLSLYTELLTTKAQQAS